MLEWITGAGVGLCVLLVVLNAIIVHAFLRRQRELELALIESKERREYLAQASARMAVQTANIRKGEYGLMHDREQDFDPLSVANRRMPEGMG